jgi:hypothetical protein
MHRSASMINICVWSKDNSYFVGNRLFLVSGVVLIRSGSAYYAVSMPKCFEVLIFSGSHKWKLEQTTIWSWLISSLMHKILIYLYIIHLLKSSTYFEHYPAHLQEVYVVTVYMQPLVSSLSAGDCLVNRLRRSSFLTGAQDSHLQRVTIP